MVEMGGSSAGQIATILSSFKTVTNLSKAGYIFCLITALRQREGVLP